MADEKQTKRRSVLDRLLGKETGEEVNSLLQSITAALDKKGVERKERSPKKIKGLLEELAERVDGMIAEITENPPADLRNRLIADIMATVAQVDEPMDEEPEMEMAEGEEDDDEEELPQAMMELGKQVKSLAEESHEIYGDIKELLPAYIDMARAVKSLLPLIKEAGRIEDLEARVVKMEKQLAGRPRQASKAAETVVDTTTPAGAKLKGEIEKGTEEYEQVLGIRVKKEVNNGRN